MSQEYDMYDILKTTRDCIVELKTQRTRLREIIAQSPQNELQREAIKTGRKLLEKLDDILSALERTN